MSWVYPQKHQVVDVDTTTTDTTLQCVVCSSKHVLITWTFSPVSPTELVQSSLKPSNLSRSVQTPGCEGIMTKSTYSVTNGTFTTGTGVVSCRVQGENETTSDGEESARHFLIVGMEAGPNIGELPRAYSFFCQILTAWIGRL